MFVTLETTANIGTQNPHSSKQLYQVASMRSNILCKVIDGTSCVCVHII